MDVYLAPASTENLNKSIINNIEINILEKYLSKYQLKEINRLYDGREIKCWGMNCGGGKYKSYYNNLKMDDYIVFAPNKSGKFKYIGKIMYKVSNEILGEELWDIKENNQVKVWKYILFIYDVEEIDINKRELFDLLEYSPKYELYGLTKLNDFRKNLFLKYIGEFNESEFIVDNQIGNDKNIKEIFDICKDKTVIGKLKKVSIHMSKISRHKMDKLNNRGYNINPLKKISDISAKLIGLVGEKVIYDTLSIKDNEILNILNILNISKIEDIIWYNKYLDLDDEEYYSKFDYSIGKGHDIKIVTQNKEILIEVKSSYSKSLQISPTSNEMRVMKDNENYYIIIVENLKNIILKQPPTIRIIESFGDDLSYELLDSISSINIYTNSRLIKSHSLN